MLVPPLYDVAHGCSGCPNMFEIALDCSPLFFVFSRFLVVFSGFWFVDMSDEVREHYPPRPCECPSQLHNNIATLTTPQRDCTLFERFRLFQL